jgi:tetratricopeptide (TPR) repeat protein
VNDALKQGENPELLSIAGKIYIEAGQLQAAEDVLKRSLQQSPQSYSDYVQLGSLVARRQRVPEAIAYFESAVKLRPADVGSWTMLGMLNQQQGNLLKSEESYIKALDIEPNAGVAANNLAWLYADRLNDMDKAMELARRAKVALPNVPNVSDTLGWIYTKRRLNEMAIPLLSEAVKSEPKHAEYRYHLAVALMQSGKKAAARQEMAAAERLDGNMRSRDQVREILQ